MSSFTAFWESLPAVVRTVVNVAAGAAVAAAVTYVVSVASGGAFSAPALLTVVLTAVGTAVVRALNPADAAYGVGAAPSTAGLTP